MLGFVVELNTIKLLSGSVPKLNSTLGLMFPKPEILDPTITNSSTFLINVPSSLIANARFVRGPSEIILTSPKNISIRLLSFLHPINKILN